MGEVIAFIAGLFVSFIVGSIAGAIVIAAASINRKSQKDDYEQELCINHMIQNQAEQIRETPAEYVARKYNIRSDADDS